MHNPLVSIIIPTFNRAHLIGETLNSISGQTYTNWECIVVNDSSTDDTETVVMDYVKKDARFQYYKRPISKTKGANACRNYGFEISKGEYINWFDDDDVMLPDFLADKMKLISDDVDLILCSGYYTDKCLKIGEQLKVSVESNLFTDFFMWKAQLVTNSVLFRRNFLTEKQLFNCKITRGQEADFFSRIFFNLDNSRFKIIEKPLFLYRQHLGTKTQENTNYVFRNKESEAFIFNNYFKKFLFLRNYGAVNKLYFILLGIFFKGIENKHFKNSFYVLKKLFFQLVKKNKRIAFEILFFGILFLVIRRSSYRFEKRWRKFKIQV
jgi:glycosyltransferase involved in cell wall biosynthesis